MKFFLTVLILCFTLSFPCTSKAISINLTETHIIEGNYYIKMHEPQRISTPIKTDFGTVTTYTYISNFLQFDVSITASYTDWTANSNAQLKKYKLKISGDRDFIESHEASLRYIMEKKFGALEKIYDKKILKNKNKQESCIAFIFKYNNQEYFYTSYMIVVDIDRVYQLDYVANKSNMALIDCKEWFDSFRLGEK